MMLFDSNIIIYLTLVTRNVDDFKWIAGLSVLNPFTLGPE